MSGMDLECVLVALKKIFESFAKETDLIPYCWEGGGALDSDWSRGGTEREKEKERASLER